MCDEQTNKNTHALHIFSKSSTFTIRLNKYTILLNKNCYAKPTTTSLKKKRNVFLLFFSSIFEMDGQRYLTNTMHNLYKTHSSSSSSLSRLRPQKVREELGGRDGSASAAWGVRCTARVAWSTSTSLPIPIPAHVSAPVLASQS